MEMEISDVVLSLAGRDRGLLFYVVDVQGEYLLLNSELRRDLAALRQAMQQSKPREVLTWPKTT